MTKRRGTYANEPRLFYPGRNLSPDDKRKMDTYAVDITDLTTDHIVYAMSRQIENNFQIFYGMAEDLIGEEKALEIAFNIGKRYGGGGYAAFLDARGYGTCGNPRLMAEYQDLVHAIRGPKHTAALFAEFDATECVVRRNACIYFSEAHPDQGKYTGAFERGCFEGYKNADANISDILCHQCVWRGDSSCEMVWQWSEERMKESGRYEP